MMKCICGYDGFKVFEGFIKDWEGVDVLEGCLIDSFIVPYPKGYIGVDGVNEFSNFLSKNYIFEEPDEIIKNIKNSVCIIFREIYATCWTSKYECILFNSYGEVDKYVYEHRRQLDWEYMEDMEEY